MPNAQIIPFRPELRENFKRLNLAWIERFFRVEKKDLEQLENPETCIAEGGAVFFLLEEGRVLGTCAVYLVSPGLYELAKMAVDPGGQGQGYGNLLMKAAEDWARAQGGKEMMILSNTILEAAISLYRKHGYATVHLGPHADYERANIEMKKIL